MGASGNCIIPESLFAQANQFGSVWAARSVYQSAAAQGRRLDPLDVFADRFALAP